MCINKRKWLSFFLWIITTCLIGWYKFNFHELWKDEWQAWFIATSPDSFLDIFKLLPIEGHPPLWYIIQRSFHLLLSFSGIVIASEYEIQIIHLLVYSAAIYFLFVRVSLPLWMRIGFLLTYFVGFEYGIVNRGYALVMMLGFATTVLALDIKKNYIYLSITSFLLCITEVYGLFMAIAMMIYLIIQSKNISVKSILIPLIATIMGAIVFILMLYAPNEASSYTYHEASVFNWMNIIRSFQSIFINVLWIGIIPTVHESISIIGVVISLALLILLLYCFRTKHAVLYSYVGFLLMMILFTSVFYLGGLRQWGMHLIFLIILFNLYQPVFSSLNGKILTFFVVSIFVFHIPFNMRIIKRDKQELFSNAILAGKYLENNIQPTTPVFAINKFFCTPVAGYANRKLYSFPYGKTFTYFKWREKLYIPDIRDIIFQKKRLQSDHLFVLSYSPLDLLKYPGLSLVIKFNSSNIRQENYYLYKY